MILLFKIYRIVKRTYQTRPEHIILFHYQHDIDKLCNSKPIVSFGLLDYSSSTIEALHCRAFLSCTCIGSVVFLRCNLNVVHSVVFIP